MAKTTVTNITDDLDGSGDATEVSFSYGGADYTIDLGKKNLTAFEKALKPYVDAATPVGRRSSSRRKAPASTPSRTDLGAVRAWAVQNSIEVSERGRVAKSVIDQYDAAH